MHDNLRMVLTGAIGSADVLESGHHTIRVAWMGRPLQGFTWAHRMPPTSCRDCGMPLDLCIVSSNAMFFVMRLLLTACTLFDAVEFAPGRCVFRIKGDATETQVEQVHTAMEVYCGYRSLSDAGLEALFAEFTRAPVQMQGTAGFLHLATITWLLLHEIGHALQDEAGRVPLAGFFLSQQNLTLDPDRQTHWLDELSADFTASYILASAAAGHYARTHPDLADAEQAGKDTGFGAGILTLRIFELYEGYEVGRRTFAGERDIARAVDYKTHPPMRLRVHFLEWFGKHFAHLNPVMVEPWQEALFLLYAEYVERHPMPD
jgi:hypothetical protein